MTAVVLVGDFPSTGIITDPVAMRVSDSPAPENSLAFLDLADQALRRSGAVLVLFPAWRREAAPRLVRMARGVLGTDRVAGIALDLPPLALSVVSDQLAFMAPHVRPGTLASLAPVLAARVYAGAWLNSVAKLETIQAGLGQHMYSYVPGSGFMVASSPVPVVHRITSSAPVAEPAFRPLDPVLMLAAHEHGDDKWVRQHLAPSLRAVSLTFVATPPLGSRYWAAKKYTEFVAFSGHPEDLQQVVRSTPCLECPWCGEPTAQPHCAFCARVQPQPAQPAAQGHASPNAQARGQPAPVHVDAGGQSASPNAQAPASPNAQAPVQPSASAVPPTTWPPVPAVPPAVPPPMPPDPQQAPPTVHQNVPMPRTQASAPPAQPVLSAPPAQSLVFPGQSPPPTPPEAAERPETAERPAAEPPETGEEQPAVSPASASTPPGRPEPLQIDDQSRTAPQGAERNGNGVRRPASDDRSSHHEASQHDAGEDEVEQDDADEGRPGTVRFRAGRPH